MTIGIGVLCSTKPKPHSPRPDALVMISDTMGSTESDSTGELHKMSFDPDNKVYAVCAEKIDVAAEVFPLIRAEFSKITGPKMHGSIWRALSLAVTNHRAEHFNYDVVCTQYSIGGHLLFEEQAKMLEHYRSYQVGYQMLVGTFDDEGMALLYYVGPVEASTALVHLMQFPGHGAIGTGYYNASIWLNYRRQKLGMSVKQSALHAYESSRIASSAPTVNDDIEICVATKERGFYLSKESPSAEECPVSLPELVSLGKRYGPRNTNALGF